MSCVMFFKVRTINEVCYWYSSTEIPAAHRESYYNGKVLHHDISAGNIIIYNGGGLLIDWDMSKDLELISDDKNILRTVWLRFS